MGTAVDHMAGVSDHAHVSGLGCGLQALGAPWVRVNPDAAYLEAIFERLLSDGLKPSLTTYNKLMESYARRPQGRGRGTQSHERRTHLAE